MAFPAGTWYVDSVAYAAVTAWAATTALSVGAIRRQLATPTVGNERCFVVISAGTTGGSEPAWSLTHGAKTTDSTVTWMECTGAAALCGSATNTVPWTTVKNTAVSLGVIIKNVAADHYFICTTAGTAGNGSEPSWNTTTGATTTDNTVTWTCLGATSSFTTAYGAPFKMFVTPINNGFAAQAGDTVYIGDDHAESTSGSQTIASVGTWASPVYAYCMDHTKATPAAADLKTTATVNVSSSFNSITFTGALAVYGVSFSGPASFGSLFLNGIALRFDSCSLTASISSGQSIQIGNSASSSGYRTDLRDVTMTFGSGLGLAGGKITWKNTTAAAIAGTAPTTFIETTSGSSILTMEGLDLSPLSGKTLMGPSGSTGSTAQVTAVNCKLPASLTVFGTPNSSGSAVQTVDLVNCDSGTAVYRHERWAYEGSHIVETTVIRTGGASDGTTGISWKIVTTSLSKWVFPFDCMPIAIWNSTIGANVTATVCGIINAAAVPNNDDLWMEASYLGSSATPIATIATMGKANNLAAGSALTADTSAWDSIATARANSHAYSVGDIIKLASNPGRLFFCTSAGTSASSEPGGYASAVDGGSVTDSGAVFRAGCRFKLALTFSAPQPQLAGDIRVQVRAAKASTTWYLDPLIVLS